MTYSVVLFLKENQVEAVPSSWLKYEKGQVSENEKIIVIIFVIISSNDHKKMILISWNFLFILAQP